MNRFPRLGVVFGRVVLIMAAALLLQPTQAQVLEQVPSDALVVVHVKNLQSINQKIAALAKQWGIVEMNPSMSDPLGYLLGEAKMTEGIDKDGDAAIVLANGDLKAEPPPIIILIPVSDYQKFIGNFAGAQKEGELDKFKMSFGGEPGDEDTYAANWGRFAALTPIKDLLAKKPEGFKPSPAAAKEIAAKDIVAVANMKILGPLAKQHIEENKDQVNGQIVSALSAGELAPYIPILKVAFTQGVNAAERFLTETDCVGLSYDFQPDGVGLGLLADFVPDSYWAKMIGSIKGTDASLLTCLPDGKYLMCAGGRSATEDVKKAFSEFLAQIQDSLSKGNETMRHISAYIDSLKSLLHDQQAVSFGIIAPTGALGTPLLQTIAVATGNAAALMKDQQTIVVSQQEIVNLLPNQPKSTVEAKPDAKTVDGVSFTQFTTTMTDTNSPTAAMAKQMLSMFYGPNGPQAFAGVVDEHHMLMYTGLDDATVSTAIKAVKDQNDPFTKDPGITQVRKHLPATKVSEAYINVADIVTTVVTYAKMLGMPLPVTMKAGVPPIGFAISTDGPSIRGDMYVPSDLIEQITAMVLQFRMGGAAKNGGL